MALGALHTRFSCKFQMLGLQRLLSLWMGLTAEPCGVLCVCGVDIHGVFGIGAMKMKKQQFGGHKFAGKSSVSSLGKRPWVLQVAGIWGCVVGGRGHPEPSVLHGRKGQKFPTGKFPRGPEMAPVFNLFRLSHSWFGLSWEELNLCQLPEPGVGGSALTQRSLPWGATGTGLLLCPPDCLSGQHADLG